MMQPVVLVTGAAKGIGFEIARRFLTGGSLVALNDQTLELVQSALEKLSPAYDGQLMGCVADVSDALQVGVMVNQVIESWGGIDILINNAGIYPSHAFLEMSEANWTRVMNVNAKGVFLVSQAVARKMIAQGKAGQIINIASGSYHSARVGSAHYCASKAAAIMLTKVIAMELASYHIRVNAIAPGLILVDDMTLNPQYIESTVRQTPVGRAGTPQEIAEVVHQLAQIESDYVTGAVISVDGGLSLGRYGIPVG
jgi:3-oxoacyl-[acyl-carrier protein] reductase